MDEICIKTKDTDKKKKDDDEDDEDDNNGSDESNFGKPKRPNDAPVVAMSSGGSIKAFVAKNSAASTLMHFARRNIKEGSIVHTDSNSACNAFKNFFKREKVKRAVEFVSFKGVRANAVESFWGNLKRGIKGQFHHISRKYMQNYINEFEYRFNRRELTSEAAFEELLARCLGI